MKIINNVNAPQQLINAANSILNKEHTKADFSATQLYKSPRQVQLVKRHKAKIEKNITDVIWALFGTSLHNLVEGYADSKLDQAEVPLSIVINDKSISGVCDLISKNVKVILSDYKVTSAWSIVFGNPDWEKQLNIYNFMLHKMYGWSCDKLRIVALLRDWTKSKVDPDGKYPAENVQVIEIDNIWETGRAEEYITERVKIHTDNESVADDDLPECSKEELWQKPTTYAIKKTGRKSAVKTEESMDELQKYAKFKNIDLNSKVYSVETRPGKCGRCDYCDASPFCSQYNKLKEEGLV
jgi:hypothetical protein